VTQAHTLGRIQNPRTKKKHTHKVIPNLGFRVCIREREKEREREREREREGD